MVSYPQATPHTHQSFSGDDDPLTLRPNHTIVKANVAMLAFNLVDDGSVIDAELKSDRKGSSMFRIVYARDAHS